MKIKKVVAAALGILLVTSSIESSPYISFAKDLESVSSNVESKASVETKAKDDKNLDNLSNDKSNEDSKDKSKEKESNNKEEANKESAKKSEEKKDSSSDVKAQNKEKKESATDKKDDSKKEEKDKKESSEKKENSDKKEETSISKEEIKKAKEELKAYLDSLNADAIDNPSVKFEDENVKAELKATIARGKELLNDENIDKAKLEEIQKFPFKKVNGKKQGLLREFAHKALVDYEIIGERNNVNPHNNKGYVALKDNKFTIKTNLKDLQKSGLGKNFLRINYVTEEDYNNTKVDAVTGSTPKYKKQELPAENYTIKAVEGGYEVTVNKLPEGVKFIKPIVLVTLANGTYFENGDLLYVNTDKKEETPTPSVKPNEEKADVNEVKKAKDELKAYLDSLNEEAIDNPSVKYADENVKAELKAAIARGRELLNDENIDKAKLEEIQKFPFKKVNGKKQGLLREFAHKALVDYEILGERNNVNPHNNKGYVALKDNKFTIKTNLRDLQKLGLGRNFLRINYVTEEDYNNTKVDAVTGSTPKYKKQELPAENYTIKAVEGGYEVTVNKLPEGVKFIKPIVLVTLANGTHFENGDLVFVKGIEKETPAPVDPSNTKKPSNETTPSKGKTPSQAKNDGKLVKEKEKKENKKVQAPVKVQKNTQQVKAQAKAPANKKARSIVRTGVESIIPALAAIVASSFALKKSKKRK